MNSSHTHWVGFHDPPDDIKSGARITLGDVDRNSPANHVNTYFIYHDIVTDTASMDNVVEAHIVGLEMTLDRIPILAGSFSYSDCSAIGPFVKVDAASKVRFDVVDLRNALDALDLETLRARGYPGELIDHEKFEVYPALHWAKGSMYKECTPVAFAQLTFVSNGAILAVGLAHKAGDNGSTNIFVKTWATCSRIHRWKKMEVIPNVLYDPSWFSPRVLSDGEYQEALKKLGVIRLLRPEEPRNIWYLGKDVQGHLIRVKPNNIQRLKQQCWPSDGSFVSTYDCVTAIITRAIVRSRLQDPKLAGISDFSITFLNSLRGKSPGTDRNYFGNSFAMGYVGPMQVSDILKESGLRHTAQASRLAIRESGLSYYQDYYNVAKTAKAKGLVHDLVARLNTGLDVMFSSWQSMALDEMDFGFGNCSAVRIGAFWYPGMVIIWPSSATDKDLGIFASIYLEREHWPAIMHDEHLLDYVDLVF